MRNILKAVCAAALMTPLAANAASASTQDHQTLTAQAAGLTLVAAAGPRAGGPGGGGFRGGYRGGGFRGGFRGGFGGPRFRGGVFLGPSFGYYDPFWYPYGYYGYGYGYGYPPPVRERDYGPPPDYLTEPEGPAPEQSWYHCAMPEGYYPYVQSCDGPWQAVPVTPEGPPPPAPAAR